MNECAIISTPSRIIEIYSVQHSKREITIEIHNTIFHIGNFEESRDGPPQQFNAREHDGREFSASRCGE